MFFLFFEFCPNARSHLALSFLPCVISLVRKTFPFNNEISFNGRGPSASTNKKCLLLLVLCLGSGAFGTTGHGTPTLRLHSKNTSTILGGYILYDRQVGRRQRGTLTSLACWCAWALFFPPPHCALTVGFTRQVRSVWRKVGGSPTSPHPTFPTRLTPRSQTLLICRGLPG